MGEIRTGTPQGGIKISKAAIETLATQATLEIEGVKGLADAPVPWKKYLLRGQTARPVRVWMNGGSAEIQIGVTLQNGYKIKRVAEQIQESVKLAVQSMTRIAVSKVNVYIAGVAFDGRAE